MKVKSLIESKEEKYLNFRKADSKSLVLFTTKKKPILEIQQLTFIISKVKVRINKAVLTLQLLSSGEWRIIPRFQK